MNAGEDTDSRWLAARLGEKMLRGVLMHAQTGQPNERSRAYGHYRLRLADVDQPPALPARSFRRLVRCAHSRRARMSCRPRGDAYGWRCAMRQRRA